jgi:hypothetical protein
MLVTTIGWSIAVFVALFLAGVIGLVVAASYGQVIFSPDPTPSTIAEIPLITQLQVVVFIGICMGMALGILQWLVLRREFPVTRNWIVADRQCIRDHVNIERSARVLGTWECVATASRDCTNDGYFFKYG